MPDMTDLQLDQRLAALERELGPTLREVYRGRGMRAEFAAEIVSTPIASGGVRRAHMKLVPRRTWAALVATLVGGLAIAVALVGIRPQPVNAADVVDQLQTEAVGIAGAGVGACPGPPPGEGPKGGDVIAVNVGGPEGPTTLSNATDLSDRLAKALGVSGDRVHQAMLAALSADMPSPPPDPMAAIAQELGLSRDQVCAAFFDPQQPGGIAVTGRAAPTGSGPGKPEVRVAHGGPNGLDLSTATAADLTQQAAKLGVSPDRLATAVHAAAADMPAPPPPPDPDTIIRRFAQNLGISEDRVRAAIAQVEGSGRFYFVVPLPGFGN